MKKPAVDMGLCTICMGCVEVCPQVFSLSEATGMIQVAEMTRYPGDLVDEAIKYCPEKAISWVDE